MSSPGRKVKSFLKGLRNKIWRPFTRSDFSPRFIALSCAVGIGAGLLPMFGQVWVCGIIWIVFRRWHWGRFSLVISAAWTFISNPFTTPFFIYGYYLLGQKILGGEILTFSTFIGHAKDIVEHESGFGNILKNSLEFLISDIGVPVSIGCPIVIAAAAPLSYFAAFAVAEKIRKKREMKHDSKV